MITKNKRQIYNNFYDYVEMYEKEPINTLQEYILKAIINLGYQTIEFSKIKQMQILLENEDLQKK